LAIPALAQDAGPLELAPGMRAYTTRVFVEPEVLAELSVGDEVSFYVTYFTAWDYLNAEGFEDTYVVGRIAKNVRILAIGAPVAHNSNTPLVEVSVRLAASLEDVVQLVFASRSEVVARDQNSTDLAQLNGYFVWVLDASGMLVMVSEPEDLPIFCETCETISLNDYYSRSISSENINRIPVCYQTERRALEVTQFEVPCRDD